MRYDILVAAALLLAGGTTSCLNDDDDDKNKKTDTITGRPYVLVTDADGNTKISRATITMNYETPSMLSRMTVEDLNTGASTVTVKTGDVKFVTGVTELEDTDYRFWLTGGVLYDGSNVSADDAVPVTSLRVDVTGASYTNDPEVLSDIRQQLAGNPLERPQAGSASSNYIYGEFNYGAFSVKTFWNDMLYKGETVTTYPGAQEPYDTDDIIYRVNIKADNQGGCKADVYFYNAKFADRQPMAVNFMLRDLPVKLSKHGFSIAVSGKNPIMVPEGTENSRFQFNDFTLSSTPDLSGVVCNYKVAGIYTGQFGGQAVLLAK